MVKNIAIILFLLVCFFIANAIAQQVIAVPGQTDQYTYAQANATVSYESTQNAILNCQSDENTQNDRLNNYLQQIAIVNALIISDQNCLATQGTIAQQIKQLGGNASQTNSVSASLP
jgi:hypothetical protein